MTEQNSETYTIRDLADEFEITTRTLRFYEDKNLLLPQRDGQKRIFSKRDRARLKLILRGKRLGFTLDEITELVKLYETPADTQPQLQKYLSTLRKHKETLINQRSDIEKTLTEIENAEKDCLDALKQADSFEPIQYT